MELTKFLGSCIIGFSLIYVAVYPGLLFGTRECNPKGQWEYIQLNKKIFKGKNCLADTDKNGRLSLIEKAIAYEKIGIEDIHQRPTLEQLRQAVDSYENQ